MGAVELTGTTITIMVLCTVLGGLVAVLVVKKVMEGRLAAARNEVERIVTEAKRDAETLKKEAVLRLEQDHVGPGQVLRHGDLKGGDVLCFHQFLYLGPCFGEGIRRFLTTSTECAEQYHEADSN